MTTSGIKYQLIYDLPANFVSKASSSRSSRAANARLAPAIFASFLLFPVPYYSENNPRHFYRSIRFFT
jgi:hypothetical protein